MELGNSGHQDKTGECITGSITTAGERSFTTKKIQLVIVRERKALYKYTLKICALRMISDGPEGEDHRKPVWKSMVPFSVIQKGVSVTK